MPDIFIISWAYQCISFTPRWVYESWLPIHWGSSVSFYRRTEEFLCNSEYRIYNGDGHISTPINSQIQWILKDWIWCAKSDRTGQGKFFTYIAKTLSNLSIKRRRMGNCYGITIFEIDVFNLFTGNGNADSPNISLSVTLACGLKAPGSFGASSSAVILGSMAQGL